MTIILKSQTETGPAFDIMDLQPYLRKIPDTRADRGKIYPLHLVLTYIILAKLAGCDKPSAVFRWVKLRQQELLTLFDTRHKRVPCLNVYRTILNQVVTGEELMRNLNQYLIEVYGGQESPLISIDGKTMRGTTPKGETQGVHLLAAYLPEEGIVLNQIAVESKENEITAAKELIEKIPLKNRIVCADAMQTQRELSVKIKARGGDYIWIAKDNQATLTQDIEQFFKPPRKAPGWHIPQLPQTTAEESDKGHGRIEKRHLTLMKDDGFLDWPNVTHVFKLEREFTYIKTGKKMREVTYGLTSCEEGNVTADLMLQWIRLYWGIENGLHYRRDVTLHEDATRSSFRNMAIAMASINNFVIGLVHKLGFLNLADARRIFDYKIASQLAI